MMKPVVSNEEGWQTFKGPKSMGNDCQDISAVTGVDAQGYPFVAMVWELTEQEVSLIKEGKEVIVLVKIIGKSLPPMAIEITEKEPTSTIP